MAGKGTRRVRLPIFGGETELDLAVPGGRGALGMVLPAARQLSKATMALSEGRERSAGRAVTCRAGCAACCRHLVPVSVVEALAISQAVAAMPPKRRAAVVRRFGAALGQLEQAGLLAPGGGEPRTAFRSAAAGDPSEAWRDVSGRYFAAAIACPLLEDERCSVYEQRPFVCREHLVTTPPERCSNLDGAAEAVPRPTFPTHALATLAEELEGVFPATIPLVLALEWSSGDAAELSRDHDGSELLDAFLNALVWGEELSDE